MGLFTRRMGAEIRIGILIRIRKLGRVRILTPIGISRPAARSGCSPRFQTYCSFQNVLCCSKGASVRCRQPVAPFRIASSHPQGDMGCLAWKRSLRQRPAVRFGQPGRFHPKPRTALKGVACDMPECFPGPRGLTTESVAPPEADAVHGVSGLVRIPCGRVCSSDRKPASRRGRTRDVVEFAHRRRGGRDYEQSGVGRRQWAADHSRARTVHGDRIGIRRRANSHERPEHFLRWRLRAASMEHREGSLRASRQSRDCMLAAAANNSA